MFYLDEIHDLAVSQVPRCGLTTIREWLGKSIVVKNTDVRLQAITNRVAFVRDPIDRLRSAFAMFFWLNDYGIRHNCKAPINSWECFVDYVLDPETKDDEHWLSQKTHIGDVPNIYHRLENINQHYEKYRPGFMYHSHKSSKVPMQINFNYRLSELIIKYADDVALYRMAT